MQVAHDNAQFFRPKHLPGVEFVCVRYRERQFPVHSHDEYVIGTVLAGAEKLIVGRSEYTVAEGGIILLNPDQAHSNHSIGQKPLSYIVFYLTRSSVQKFSDFGYDKVDLTFPCPTLADKPISQAIIHAYDILSRGDADLLTQQSVMTKLTLLLTEKTSGSFTKACNGTAGLQRSRDWINSHFMEDFGLCEIAAIAGLSTFHFARQFKDAFGISPIAYRNQRRVNEARRLLLTGSSIIEAALHVGFADQSHLTRQFQRLIGTSPGKYLQQERSRS